MVERYQLRDEEISTSRAAVIASELTDAICSTDNHAIRVEFESACLEADYLVRYHDFGISPATERKNAVELFKRKR